MGEWSQWAGRAGQGEDMEKHAGTRRKVQKPETRRLPFGNLPAPPAPGHIGKMYV